MRIVLEWSCASLTVVQTLSCVWLFATPQTVAHKSPLSSIISQNLLKFISLCQWCSLTISSSADPFFFCPWSFPALQSFPVSELFASGGQSIRTQLQHQSFQWIFRVISFRNDCANLDYVLYLAVTNLSVCFLFCEFPDLLKLGQGCSYLYKRYLVYKSDYDRLYIEQKRKTKQQ